MVKRKNTDVDTIAYKFRIYPDREQRTMLAKTFGCTRYLWNRMLADHTDLYKIIGEVPDNTPADYKTLDECIWLNEVDSIALANVQLAQQQAFEMFYKKKSGYPVFHKKHARQSYTTNWTNGNIKLSTDSIKLPKISTPIKMKQHRKIKAGGKLKSVTVSMDTNGHYFISILFAYPQNTFVKEPAYQPNPETIGLDMQLNSLYVDHNGNSAHMPDFYRHMEMKLAKEQAKLSHMTKKSHNYRKQLHKINKLHMKIKCQRMDFLRKEAHKLTSAYDVICIEDLDLKSMASRDNYETSGNGKKIRHGKSVHSIGYGMFVQFLNWDCQKTGHVLIKADRYFASTQICSHCGHQQEMDISDRIYICPVCHHTMDRDQNSAVNIRTEGLRLYHEQNKTA